MAYRPVFYGDAFGYKKYMIDFEFFTGFSLSQKQKSIQSLHNSIIRTFPERKILEVSSKSLDEIGRQASAFNLNVILKSGKEYSVEQIFQGSKKFRRGGSQLHLINQMTSKELKKYIGKVHQVDELVSFECFGQVFPLKPQTFFYNWLYINTLHQNQLLANQIIKYDTFTDIEFNPKRSINCQAEACSIYVYLYKSNLLDYALSSKENFLQVVYHEQTCNSYSNTKENNTKEISLFGYEEVNKQSRDSYSKKVPKYRNSSFNDEWIRQSLGKTVEIILGQSPDSKNYTDNPNDYILVQGNADMKNGRVVPRVWTTQITKLAEKGDLILSVRAPVGDVGKTDYNVVLGRGVAAIKGNEFLFQLLIKMKQSHYWSKFSTGSTFESINSNDIKSAEIYLPSIEEQSAIGSLFHTLDDLLASYKVNLANYQSLKAAMLSKMFPKAGQTVPEIRLDEFEGEWECLKMADIFKIIDGDRGKNYPGESDFFNVGHTLFLDTGNVKKTGLDFSSIKFISEEKDKELRNGKLILGDFILTSRGTLGNVAYYDENIQRDYSSVRINSAMLILRPLLGDKISHKYILAILRGNLISDFMKVNQVGSAQPHITKKEFSKIKVQVPSNIREQQAIGAYFSNLDQLITSYQEKITQLETLKKKLLQDMFI